MGVANHRLKAQELDRAANKRFLRADGKQASLPASESRSVFTTRSSIPRRPEAELFAVARLHADHGLFLRQRGELRAMVKQCIEDKIIARFTLHFITLYSTLR